ncbi:hypothetical protein [Acaryochloris marina]|uniref:Uncharacterized protein n=1 Tax=Acaryochloris marina (strain MBIC 11017) TaxID=329726 RepID=A8ZQ97_ACAM1|nr:hypothetical protein [Acaryochloris marina]ABW33183.1 hypothetical protein AM1_G0003 [Acaryochloris marina MBIC11017]
MKYIVDISNILLLIYCAKVLKELIEQRKEFCDDKITYNDLKLAKQVVIFFLLPLSVPIHEFGHCLAVWHFGGIVTDFQWRFFWGYIKKIGIFYQTDQWWVSLFGNLLSFFTAIICIPFFQRIRKRIIAEIIYFYIYIQLIFVLIVYPISSILLQFGDWLIIYNFEIQPHASLIVIAQIILLICFWCFDSSRWVVNWRLSRESHIKTGLEKIIRKLEDSGDIENHLNLIYFYFSYDEHRAAKRHARKVCHTWNKDKRIEILKVIIKYHNKKYKKAIKDCWSLLEKNYVDKDKVTLYRVLSLSMSELEQYSNALTCIDRGLEIDPNDFKLRYYRAFVLEDIGEFEAVKESLIFAREVAQSDRDKEMIDQWLKKYE